MHKAPTYLSIPSFKYDIIIKVHVFLRKGNNGACVSEQVHQQCLWTTQKDSIYYNK